MIFFFHSCNKILSIIINCVPLKKRKKTKNSFAYQALAFKVVWHTPFQTFKGGDPINALFTTLSYTNFFFFWISSWELWLVETMWESERKKTKQPNEHKDKVKVKTPWKQCSAFFCLFVCLNDYQEKVLSLLVLNLLITTALL